MSKPYFAAYVWLFLCMIVYVDTSLVQYLYTGLVPGASIALYYIYQAMKELEI